MQPTIKLFQNGRNGAMLAHQPDKCYQKYLFSVKDFVETESKLLKDCWTDYYGINATCDWWYTQHKWTRSDFDQHDNNNNVAGLEPLIDLDGACYSDTVFSKQVLRPQWKEMQQWHPENIILNRNIF
jgi:hypothetical protein